MNDEVEINVDPVEVYVVYGNVYTYCRSDGETWLLIQSIRNLNKCGVEVDYSNRNEIVHGQRYD